mgnify:CR=1 FL=1|tara:strand:- start:633 stop:1373 length:741 start_codon:yes stop_codon:yes gene_type:complete
MSYKRKVFNLLTRFNKAGTKNEATRNNWVASKLSGLPSGLRILDAGAGEQQYKKYCTHLNYISQDFAQYDGVGDNIGLQTGKWDNSNLDIICDIANIPEPDAAFDVILCTEVFEHLPNPVLAIQEFSRLLKSGGQLFITAPFCSLTHFAPYHYSTGFNRYYYEKHFADNGLKAFSVEANGNYFEYVAQELRRIEDVAILNSKKKHPNLLQRIAIWVVLNMLNKMSRTDCGSSELLHFGCHVHAVKI